MKLLLFPVLLLLPFASACFVSSDIEISVDEPPAIPVGKQVTINANVTLSWGFGAIFPLPVVVELSIKEAPYWLSASLSQNKINFKPSGFFGGSESKIIQINLIANEEVEAFVPYKLILYAHTNGSLLVRGAEREVTVNVMEDFYDRGLDVEKPSIIKAVEGKDKTFYINITNKCNAPVNIKMEMENLSGFFVSYSKNNFNLPSKSEKRVRVTLRGENAGNVNAMLKISYSTQTGAEKELFVPLSIKVYSRGGGGGAVAIAIAVVVAVLILFFAWWKKR